MSPLFRWRLLGVLRARRSTPHRRHAEGSIVTVIFVALAILLGTITLLGRTNYGYLGAAYQDQSREARDAAETGMSLIVSELNREPNRRLAVNAPKLNSYSRTQIEADPTLANDCTTVPPALSTTFSGTDLKAVQAIDASRSFQLVSVSQPASDSETQQSSPYAANSSFVSSGVMLGSAVQRSGSITLSVRGTVVRGGRTVGVSTVTRTFEVIPKCCSRAPGGLSGSFGNDNRLCGADLGMGVVGGTALEDTGTFSFTGKATDVITETGIPIDHIYCLASSENGCNISRNTPTTVKVVNAVLPPVKLAGYSGCTSQGSNDPGSTHRCNIVVPANLTLSTNVDRDNGRVEEWENIPALSEWYENCRVATVTDPPGSAPEMAIHCSLNRLIVDNNVTLTINTTNGLPLVLNFPNTPDSACTGTAKADTCYTVRMRNGNSVVEQIDTGPSNTRSITKLRVLGRQSGSPDQLINFGSGTTNATRMFLYAPTATVTLQGAAGFEGVLWADHIGADQQLSVNGNVKFVVPGTGLSDVLKLMGISGMFMQPETFTNRLPIIDYSIRGTKSFQYF
ncbi:MAG: hypothetical protein VKI83_12140 [Synechococcaceae cyanobacterium]|nr:hypothetical protein [Synechococcaceae cyanobacterium]